MSVIKRLFCYLLCRGSSVAGSSDDGLLVGWFWPGLHSGALHSALPSSGHSVWDTESRGFLSSALQKWPVNILDVTSEKECKGTLFLNTYPEAPQLVEFVGVFFFFLWLLVFVFVLFFPIELEVSLMSKESNRSKGKNKLPICFFTTLNPIIKRGLETQQRNLIAAIKLCLQCLKQN